MDIKSDIGLKIRALRKQKNINQSALAEMIERSPEAVSNLERGVSLPSMETLIRLSQQLNTPLTYFFDNTLDDGGGSWRTELIAELQTIAYSLSDQDLELAVDQMRALNKNRKE